MLLQAFMGSGKTVFASWYARRWVAQGERVLILVHRGEILKQTMRKLIRAGVPAADIGVIWANHGGMNVDAPIQLASVQTLTRREAPKGITRVIVDEAHHASAGSWKTILGWYPTAQILGLTATPERLDGKPLSEFFDELVIGELPENLIDSGLIVKPEIWTREDGWRPKKLQRHGGDYRAEDAARAMGGSTIVRGIPAAYKKRAVGKPAVLFGATKEQVTELVRKFVAVGVPAETIFSEDTETDREAKLQRLRSGKTLVLGTCDILGEGWDYDGCRCVIMARPTASLARYLQWAGRGMRKGGPSVILDHAGNFYAHGPPWAEQEWSLDGAPRKSLLVPSVGPDGRVTFLEPKEVAGRLVRADEIVKQTVCAGALGEPCPHAASPSRTAFSTAAIKKRGGGPWLCRSCATRRMMGAMTPRQRGDRMRKAWASMSPTQRSEARRRSAVTMGPERMREARRKVTEAMTPEERREMTRAARETPWTPERRAKIARVGRNVLAKMTPEQRSEMLQKSRAAIALRTPQQRREATRKRLATRRARAGIGKTDAAPPIAGGQANAAKGTIE